MKDQDKKEIKKPARKSASYHGIVIDPFILKKKSYAIGAKFSTKDKFTYDTFINHSKIKAI